MKELHSIKFNELALRKPLFKKKISPEDISFPVEISFYEDHLLIYRHKRYCGFGRYRRELLEIWYKDISSCVYNEERKVLCINGTMTSTCYYYEKTGYIEYKPLVRTVKDARTSIDMSLTSGMDVVKEIEMYSVIKAFTVV